MAMNGSIGDAVTTAATLPALPYSLSIWFKPLDLTSRYCLFVIYDAVSYNFINVAVTTGVVSAGSGSGGEVFSPGNAITASTWHNLVAVFTSTTSRLIYVDGVAGTLNSPSKTAPSGGSQHYDIGGGALGFGTVRGAVEYPAVWTIALNQTDITALQTTLPSGVQASSLYGFWTIANTDPQIDQGSGGHNMTNTVGVNWNYVAYDGPALGSGGTLPPEILSQNFKNQINPILAM
jgi:hypothetical protein